MKKMLLLALTLCVVSVNILSAQSPDPLPRRDSINVLLEFSLKIYRTYPDQARKLAERAFRYATEENDILLEGKSSLMLGMVYKELNDPQRSLREYRHALQLFETLNDSTRIGRTYNAMGTVYLFNLNHVTWSSYYLNKAKSYLQHDSVNLANVLTNIGSLKLRTGNLDEALALYRSAYEIQQKHNDLPRMSVSLNNIATVLDHKKDFRASIEYYQKSLQIERILENRKSIATVLLGLAGANCQNGAHDQAEVYLRESMAISKKYSFHGNYVSALQYMAYECEHTHKLSEAKNFALEANTLADKYHLSHIKGEIYHQLSILHEKMGELKEALVYQQKCSSFKDSIANVERKAATDLADLKEKTVQASTPAPVAYWPWLSLVLVGSASLGLIFYRKRKHQHHSPTIAEMIMNDTTAHTVQEYIAPDDVQDTISDNVQDIASGNNPVSEYFQAMTSDNGMAMPKPAVHLEVINGQGMKLINLDDVQWFQKEGKSYHAFTEKGNYRVRQNMTDLEDSLPKTKFFRINRSVIINTSQMSNYSFWENHKYIIRMRDPRKSEFTISRNRLREMKETFNVFEN
jgi:DNA-binding LytR/AlgR family response regulator/tetratricopeptide (TPR) repeat protein